MPVALKCLVWYEVIEMFVKKYELLGIPMSGYKEKKTMRKVLQARELACDIKGLSLDEAVIVWEKLEDFKIMNRQRYCLDGMSEYVTSEGSAEET